MTGSQFHLQVADISINKVGLVMSPDNGCMGMLADLLDMLNVLLKPAAMSEAGDLLFRQFLIFVQKARRFSWKWPIALRKSFWRRWPSRQSRRSME